MSSVAAELEHRLALWSEVSGPSNDGTLVASTLNELRVYYGGRGIWVHKERTTSITPEGVTVGVLHTGRSYADDLHVDGIVYQYPRTKRPGTDAAEVEATKAAHRLGLPVFVVVQRSGSRRTAFLGWVTDWDDSDEMCLIRFGESAPPSPPSVSQEDEQPFELTKAFASEEGDGHHSSTWPGAVPLRCASTLRCGVCGLWTGGSRAA